MRPYRAACAKRPSLVSPEQSKKLTPPTRKRNAWRALYQIVPGASVL